MSYLTRTVRKSLLAAAMLVQADITASGARADDLIKTRDKTEIYVPIEGVAIHPWFGVGSSTDWDRVYSKFVDMLFEEKADGSYSVVPGAGLSALMLAVLEKHDLHSKQKPADSGQAESPDMTAARNKFEQLKSAMEQEADPVKKARIKRDLDDVRKELQVAQANAPQDSTEASRIVTEGLLESVSARLKDIKLSEDLLLSRGKPGFSEFSLYNNWKTAAVDLSRCAKIADPPPQQVNLSGFTASGPIGLFDISRTWLVGPLLNTKATLDLSGTKLADKVGKLGSGKIYRVSGMVIARELVFSGSFAPEFYTAVSSSSVPKTRAVAGCYQVYAADGLGFSSGISLPIPTASGATNRVPQVLGVIVTPLPTISMK